LAERGAHGRVRPRRRAVEKSDHWHCWLLRARRPRPRGHTSAHQRNELASPHATLLGRVLILPHRRSRCASQQNQPPDDRYGSGTPFSAIVRHVGFAPNIDRIANIPPGRRRANAAPSKIVLTGASEGLYIPNDRHALKGLARQFRATFAPI
jgi:hypothetical protein